MIHGFIYAREENLYILLNFIKKSFFKKANIMVNVLYEEEYQLYEDDIDKLNHMFSVGICEQRHLKTAKPFSNVRALFWSANIRKPFSNGDGHNL